MGLPGALVWLQRRAGNRAVSTLVNAGAAASPTIPVLVVQRLLPRPDQLEQQAGPRKDTRFLVFEMSKTYGNVLDALGQYHALLNMRMTQPPQSGHLASIFGTLDALEKEVRSYVSKHKDDYLKNLEAKRTATSADDQLALQVRLDRYRAIDGLDARILTDRASTERAQMKLLSREQPPVGWTWGQFIHPPAVPFSVPAPSIPTPGTLAGSPRERGAGSGAATTTHRELSVTDLSDPSVAYTDAPLAQAGTPGATKKTVTTIKPGSVRRSDAAVETSIQATDPPQLYEVVSGPAGGLDVSVMQPPSVSEVLSDALFIGGGPHPDDVRQTGIGDCFYLAVITSMANRDPVTIKSIIKPAGSGGVAVTFHRFDSKSNKWIPQTLDLDRKLAFRSGGGLAGANARFAPAKSRWWAAVVGGSAGIPALHVYRQNVFEAALWAPLLEKAYARFAQDYHRYGDAPGSAALLSALTPGASGYDVIDEGGLERMVYGVLYGARATAPGQDQSANMEQLTPGAPTASVIKTLLQMKGRGLGAGETMHVTASIPRGEQIRRAKAIVDTMDLSIHTEGTADIVHLRSVVTDPSVRLAFRTQLQAVSAAMQTYQSAVMTGADDGPARTLVGDLAYGTTTTSASWAAFFYPPTGQPPGSVSILLEHLAAVLRLGSVQSTRMFVFANHAYTVMDVSIRDTTGHGVDFNEVDAKLNQISLTRSTVVLRNPHRGNVPNPTGTAEAAPTSGPGTFKLTLEQFLRQFGRIDFGRIASA